MSSVATAAPAGSSRVKSRRAKTSNVGLAKPGKVNNPDCAEDKSSSKVVLPIWASDLASVLASGVGPLLHKMSRNPMTSSMRRIASTCSVSTAVGDDFHREKLRMHRNRIGAASL